MNENKSGEGREGYWPEGLSLTTDVRVWSASHRGVERAINDTQRVIAHLQNMGHPTDIYDALLTGKMKEKEELEKRMPDKAKAALGIES